VSARREGRPGLDAGRVLEVEDSTVLRAGESATRVALEETLLRKGWRVLWFEDTVGPLEGADRARLLDGVAVRMRPGEEEALEFRLLRVQSGTLDVPEGAADRMRRITSALDASWLLAAFDGEQMRLIPDLDAEQEEPELPPTRGERKPSRGQPPPERGRTLQREPPRGERPQPAPREREQPRERPQPPARDRERPARGEGPQLPRGRGHYADLEPDLAEGSAREPEAPRARGRRRGGRGGRGSREGAAAHRAPAGDRARSGSRAPAAAQQATPPAAAEKSGNGRRRGRRGGRGRRR
jgi:hypothetical protein